MEKLAYRLQKETVTDADYIAWAHRRLQVGDESPALLKLSALTQETNIFEVESYFQNALRELELELPTLDNYETIKLLATNILSTTDDEEINLLAREIFHLVSDLGYPGYLSDWVEISDMQDRLQYDKLRPPYSAHDIIEKIQEAARMATMKYTCPCCGYKTLDEQPTGTYEICLLCFWEDCPVQFEDANYVGGANGISLREAQQNVVRFGVSEESYIDRGDKRKEFEKDPNWRAAGKIYGINDMKQCCNNRWTGREAMFYLTKERQMLFDAANRYIFDEELSEETKQDLYHEFDEYEQMIPAYFFERIQNKELFHDEALLKEFEQWCNEVKEAFINNSDKHHQLREAISIKLDRSAQEMMQRSFHDGEILTAQQSGNDFTLLLDMSGGFLPHAYVKLTFSDAKLEGEIEGYYIYDELMELQDGFGLRILSSFGYPYAEGTLAFRDVSLEGVYRPAVYKEPGDVSDWSAFKSRLNMEFDYFILEDGQFKFINVEEIIEAEDGFYINNKLLGTSYDEISARILCDRYEDPYAHLSEPLENDELYDAVFGQDQTLRVRALNTLFAKGEEVAPIVAQILFDAELTEENEMYFFALANHFYQLQLIDEVLYLKWK